MRDFINEFANAFNPFQKRSSPSMSENHHAHITSDDIKAYYKAQIVNVFKQNKNLRLNKNISSEALQLWYLAASEIPEAVIVVEDEERIIKRIDTTITF